ncbi:unnamed protein product [Brachionus calyciflorus]|uniref:Uncharacterized protein n=1 Tax=Brachionus calyciflorus TaxID=104777 RepID=A0A814MWF9_9BILA|nr:unnamed protein product [Brachionus calyciflorus]
MHSKQSNAYVRINTQQQQRPYVRRPATPLTQENTNNRLDARNTIPQQQNTTQLSYSQGLEIGNYGNNHIQVHNTTSPPYAVQQQQRPLNNMFQSQAVDTLLLTPQTGNRLPFMTSTIHNHTNRPESLQLRNSYPSIHLQQPHQQLTGDEEQPNEIQPNTQQLLNHVQNDMYEQVQQPLYNHQQQQQLTHQTQQLHHTHEQPQSYVAQQQYEPLRNTNRVTRNSENGIQPITRYPQGGVRDYQIEHNNQVIDYGNGLDLNNVFVPSGLQVLNQIDNCMLSRKPNNLSLQMNNYMENGLNQVNQNRKRHLNGFEQHHTLIPQNNRDQLSVPTQTNKNTYQPARQEILQQQQQQPLQTIFVGPPQPLPEYDGTTEVLDFKRIFERTALLSGWSPDQQAIIVRTYLKNDPYDFIDNLGQIDKRSIEVIMDKLVERYGKKKATLTQFNELRPNHNESLLSFQTRLRKVLNKIDLRFAENDKDKLVKDKLINSLPDKFKDVAMYNSSALNLRELETIC